MKEPYLIFRELEESEDRSKELRNKFLRAMGWEHTSNVGALWMWTKEINGNRVYVGESTALSLAENECDFPDIDMDDF